MQKYEDNLASRLNGNALQPLALVEVRVTDDSTGLPAALYSDDGVTSLPQPLITDNNGGFAFYAANGEYTLTFSGQSIATFTRKVILDDPSENKKATLAELAAPSGSSLIGFMGSTPDAIARVVQDKLRDVVSVTDFGVKPGNAQTRDERYAAWVKACNSMRLNGHDLWVPAGDFGIGANNYPWHQAGTPSGMLDFKGGTIYCAGPQTVFSTTSPDGADVFQLNAIKNLNIVGFPTVTATLTGTAGAGSNGVSITNGGDNLYLEITGLNLPSIDKGTYIDGGKAGTIQTGGVNFGFGKITLKIRAKGCAEAFGVEPDLVNALTDKTMINVDVVGEDCYLTAKDVAGAATGALRTGMWSGLNITFKSINCQHDVVINRAHGARITGEVIATKSKAQLLLNPQGVQWFASDSIVDALLCTYAKNAVIDIRGEKRYCDYKARIGGIGAGSSGMSGATEHCDITLDIGGTADVDNVLPVNSGGNIMSDSRLAISSATSATLSNDFYLASRNNTIIIGPSWRLKTPKFAGRTSFALGTDGVTESAAIDVFSGVAGIQSKTASSANVMVLGLYDNAGNMGLGIKNGARPWLPSTVPVYADNAAATAAGYVAGDVYRTSTGALMVVY